MNQTRKKLVIICPSHLPVPAVLGGAIESLIQNFIDENERTKLLEVVVISHHHKKALNASKKYQCCTFIWINREPIDYLIVPALKIQNFIKRFFLQEPILTSIYCKKIKKFIKNSSFDFVLVEGNGAYLHHIAGIVPRNKLFFHIHSHYHCEDKAINRYLMNLPCRIISVSNFIKSSLIANLGLDCNHIITVRNCVGNHFFKDNKHEFSCGNKSIDPNNLNLVFTGRIVKEKGIIELVNALSALKEFTNWHLNIIGSFGSTFGVVNRGKMESGILEQEIRSELTKIDGRYTLHGYCSNQDIVQLFKNYDLAFSPSICKDAAPLVIGEYICSGIPVIASDQGGIPEYLNNGCGLLIKLDEDFVKKLSETIKHLLVNAGLIRNMSENCLNNKTGFSSKLYYDGLIEVLTKTY